MPLLLISIPTRPAIVSLITLNTRLRANMVKSLVFLDKYPNAGHSAVMGRVENDWQDVDYVLGWFGKRVKSARSKYHDFIKEGLSMGKRPDLTGGGLVRSAGRWLNPIEMRRAKVFVKGDERILGEGEFKDGIWISLRNMWLDSWAWMFRRSGLPVSTAPP